MNDFEILLAMLEKAGACFDVNDNNSQITIYGFHYDNVIECLFDEKGNVITID